MSKRSELLVACMLGNRWNATHAPAAAATVVANSPAILPTARTHLEALWYSISNQMGAGALVTTTTISVRQASAAGTVMASADHLTAPSTTTNVNLANMGLSAKRGNAIAVTMSTVIASVTQKVNMAGWIEDTNG